MCDPSLTGAHKYMQMKNEWKSLDPPLPCKNKKDCTKQNFSSKVMAGVVTGILVLEVRTVFLGSVSLDYTACSFWCHLRSSPSSMSHDVVQ